MTRFIVLLAAILSLSFTALAEDQTKKYTDPQAGFSVNFPTTWNTLPNYMGTHVLSLSPLENKDDPYRENISIVVENLPKHILAQNYYLMYSDIMSRTLKQFKIVSTTNVTLNNEPAVQLVATYEGADNSLTTEEYFLTKGSKGYVITATALTTDYEQFRPLLEKILISLKIDETK
jgi:hypothetical protein